MAIFSQGAFVIDPNETPASIAKKRAMIQSLMMNYGSADTIGEGIGQLFNGIGVGMANRKADKAEKAGMESGRTASANIMNMLMGGTSAPKLSGPYPSAPAAPNSQQTSTAPISATGVDVAKRLQADFGLSPAAAAGFAGNLAHESGNFKTLQEINPTVKGSRGGFGWAQWTGPRRRAYEGWAAQNGLDPSSPEANYGFLKHELTNTPEGAVIKALQGVNDPAQAAQIVSDKFLRPGVPHMGSRISKSQQIANMLMGKDTGVQVASLDPSIGMNALARPQVPNPAAQAVNAMAANSPAQAQQLSPAPQPVQMAQAAPQAPQSPAMGIQDVGTPFERMAPQSGGLDLPALMQAIQNPFVDETTKAFAMQRIQQEQQKQDPAYQTQQQMDQLGLQKAQLELQQMRQPKPQARVLNEAEKRQLGLPVNGSFQMKPDGTVDQIGGGGVTVNNEGSIPAGYQAIRDEQGRVISIAPLPGSPAYVDAEAAKNKVQKATDVRNTAANVVTDDIDRIFQTIDSATLPTTGFLGNMLSDVGGTASNDVKSLTNTIKANASFDKLQAMREASPTGGALGAVSDTELGLLSSAIGSLEQSQSEAQFKDNLARIQNIYLDIIHGEGNGPKRRELAYKGQQAAPSAAPAPATQGGMSLDDLLKKY